MGSDRNMGQLKLTPPRVFMDTSIFKSAIRTSVFGKHKKIYDSEGNQTGGFVPIIERNLNDEANIAVDDRRERNLVEDVAKLAKRGQIEAVTSNEVFMEFSKLPKTFPSSTGPFHGASYKTVLCPVRTSYSARTTKEDLRSYIEGITNPRSSVLP